MKKWTVGGNCTIHQVLSGFFNAYLIQDHQDIMLIDTGHRRTFSTLNRNIGKIVDGKSINYLVLTHTHYDHCGNAASIKESYGAKVIVNSKEAEFLKDGSTPLPRGTNLFTYVLSNLGNKHATSWYLYNAVVADVEIIDSYAINNNVKIISTPGHSKGSVTVVVKDQYAIVGDALFGSPRGSIFPQFADEKIQLLDTWRVLLNNTDCHTFLPGHGKPITRDRLEKEVLKRKL